MARNTPHEERCMEGAHLAYGLASSLEEMAAKVGSQREKLLKLAREAKELGAILEEGW